LTPAQETQQLRLLENYIKALKENIHSRFDGELPIVSGFSIFNPLMLPAPGTGSFTEQGSKQVKTLADHFYQGHQEEKTKKEELLAEWEKFKFDMDLEAGNSRRDERKPPRNSHRVVPKMAYLPQNRLQHCVPCPCKHYRNLLVNASVQCMARKRVQCHKTYQD